MYEDVPIEANILDGVPELDFDALTPTDAHKRPKLKKFSQSIYSEVEFSSSAVYDYIQAFYVGFQFDKYNKGQQCFEETTLGLDTAFGFNKRMIQRYTWADPMLYTSQQLATHINNSWYDCWQFKTDFIDTYEQKKNNFVDFSDLYLSFIFNLLGNSFQLKVASENMLKASATHDMVSYF